MTSRSLFYDITDTSARFSTYIKTNEIQILFPRVLFLQCFYQIMVVIVDIPSNQLTLCMLAQVINLYYNLDIKILFSKGIMIKI